MRCGGNCISMVDLDDEGKLIRRVEALEHLLVCYRISKTPSEKLFAELDQTREWYIQITDRRSRGE